MLIYVAKGRERKEKWTFDSKRKKDVKKSILVDIDSSELPRLFGAKEIEGQEQEKDEKYTCRYKQQWIACQGRW